MLSTKVHENPDVYLIKIPFENLKLDSTNCYIVVDGNDALLVDTGAPSDEGLHYLQNALQELGINPQRLSFFLTHLHLDHAGLLDRIAPPDATVYLNENDYRRTQPEEVERRYEALYRTLVAEGADPDSARCSIESRSQFSHIIQQDHRFVFTQENDEIAVGNYRFTVLETPGHTPGHQVLYQPESGLLFGGDHILFIMSPGIGLFLPDAEGNGGNDGVRLYLDSLSKILRLSPKTLLHSHGPIRPDVNERIEWLAQHQRQRAERVLSLLKENPNSTGFEITQDIGFKLPHSTWEDIPCVQKLLLMEIGATFLRHLELRGKIEAHQDPNGIRRYRVVE